MEKNHKKRLVSLDPREYEHPLDREALNKLESIPGVKPLFQKIYKEIYEKFFYIQNSGSNLLLTKDNAPRVTKILNQAAKVDLQSLSRKVGKLWREAHKPVTQNSSKQTE